VGDSRAETVTVVTKWDFDLFRDALNNANQTLRYQLSLGVPLLFACVTVLNIVPPQAHQELLNQLDRWVFIPVLLSMAVLYKGLEAHWYYDGRHTSPPEEFEHFYDLVRLKYRLAHLACFLQGLGLVLLGVFVLLEYK